MNFARCTAASISSPDMQSIYVFGGFDNGPLKSVEKLKTTFLLSIL